MFTFSKKQLTVGLVLLFAFSEAVRADIMYEDSDSNDLRWNRRNRMEFASKTSGFWKLCKENKALAFLSIFAVIIALVALFAPMTWANKDAGKMIFGDQGASMWLRLAVALSCLTFCIGTASVAFFCRGETRDGMNEREYIAHRQQPEQRRKTNKLLLGFYLALFAIAILVGSCGWDGNADNVMFHFAWAMPFVIGFCGVTHLFCCRWKSGNNTMESNMPDGADGQLAAIEFCTKEDDTASALSRSQEQAGLSETSRVIVGNNDSDGTRPPLRKMGRLTSRQMQDYEAEMKAADNARKNANSRSTKKFCFEPIDERDNSDEPSIHERDEDSISIQSLEDKDFDNMKDTEYQRIKKLSGSADSMNLPAGGSNIRRRLHNSMLNHQS